MSEPRGAERLDGLPFWAGEQFRQAVGWSAAFLALSALVGALAAVFWVQVVNLPSYTVRDDYSARTTERGLTEYFATDAWFTLIGLVLAASLGLLAWKWLSALGWPVAVIAAGGALLAGLVCWQLGQSLGPGPFDARLGAANPGDVVPIEFLLRSPSTLAVWVLAGVAPVLVWSSLGPDNDEPAAERSGRWTALPRSRPAIEAPADAGEVLGRDIDPMAR